VTNNVNIPEIVDNASRQRLIRSDHLQFVLEQRDEEVVLRRFSDPFTPLLPGMTTVLLWVVPKPHSDKLHLVVDQSAGDFSPNSLIPPEDARVHLDTLLVLGKALIHVRQMQPDTWLILFKTDVSQAYWRLPVHPLWQLHQIITIEGMHHVDNNNDFRN
jgi:hypothetical protein